MRFVDYINKVGYSNHDCSECKRGVTNPSYFYSTKNYGRVLCYSCGKSYAASINSLEAKPVTAGVDSSEKSQSPKAPAVSDRS